MDHPRYRISVFGGSQPKPEDPPYQAAHWLGRSLGESGWAVLTGGYIGVMEAVSRGAAESGGHVVGVTCDEIESWRPVKPNPWVMEEIRFPTTRERLYSLVADCDAALALPGGIGTLAEISFMWSQLQTRAIPSKPLILVGPEWQAIFDHFTTALGPYVAEKDTQFLSYAPDVKVAFHLLRVHLNRSG